jgi:hypothetical protein
MKKISQSYVFKFLKSTNAESNTILEILRYLYEFKFIDDHMRLI